MRSGQRPADLLMAPPMDKVASTLRPEIELPEPQVKTSQDLEVQEFLTRSSENITLTHLLTE